MADETKAPDTNDTLIISDSMREVMKAKRTIEAIAKDRDQSDSMRRYAREVLRPLNALLAEALTGSV